MFFKMQGWITDTKRGVDLAMGFLGQSTDFSQLPASRIAP